MNTPEIGTIDHHYAGVLIVTKSGKMIGQKRDDKPGIDQPGKIGFFGGTVEPGEKPRYAAWREVVKEETNLSYSEDSFTLLFEDKGWRELTEEWEARHFYYITITDDQLRDLEVYEGQGWAEIFSPDDPLLADMIRPVIKFFLEQRSSLR
jgi:ADP-ribose pyrophosphatase YjhB (NUDIX family)